MLNKKSVKKLLSIVIAFVLLYLLYGKIDGERLNSLIESSDKKLILFSVLVLMLTQIVSAIRWKILVTKWIEISFSESLKMILSTGAFNLFLPSKGGDLIKGFAISRDAGKKNSLFIVVYEKGLDFIALISIAMLAPLFGEKDIVIGLVALGCLIGFVVFLRLHFPLTIPFKNKYVETVNSWFTLIAELQGKNKVQMSFLLLLSIGNWYLHVLQFYLVFLSLGSKVALAIVFSRVPFCILAGILPISLAGLGTRDAAFLYYFKDFANEETIALVGAFAFFRYVFVAVLGLPFVKKYYGYLFKGKEANA